MSDVLPPAGTPFGDRVRQRLRDERVIWLTTVGADGTPQPNPVWFLWQDPSSLLIYNRAEAHRLAHIARNSRVALHLDGDGQGGNIVVLTGSASVVSDHPLAHEHPEYIAKYEAAAARVGGTPAEFAAQYPVALIVHVDKVRGF
jgi:PPOX class probable F420-dependent enzyme